MRAILPLHMLIVHQPHVGFVDESGCLQAVAGTFTSHVAVRQTVKFRIHDRDQSFERVLVSLAPSQKELPYFVPSRLTTCSLLHWSQIIPVRSPEIYSSMRERFRLPSAPKETGGIHETTTYTDFTG